MADQGRWFKLWCSALNDAHLDALSLEDFGRWCKLGVYLKEQGTNGSVLIVSPAPGLCATMQVQNIEALKEALLRLPNVQIRRDDTSDECNRHTFTVSMHNWRKYQHDSSAGRMRKLRSKIGRNVTVKKRGEEKRGEESKEVVPKQRHGEGQRVLLTQVEHAKLLERFGATILAGLIERLDNGIGSKGYRYKSHYSTILNWAAKDGITKPAPKDPTLFTEDGRRRIIT